MKVLRICRIDREKMEAVESFIKHGGEELHYLTKPEHMHEIMNMFIFQASRRILLARLMKEFEESGGEVDEGNKEEGDEIEGDSASMKHRQRAKNLEAALKAADEEVKRLEYWSDVRRMAEKGETIGAVDDEKGWDGNWEGLDGSGPKDAKFDGKVMEGEKGNEEGSIEGKENEKSDNRDKGKERAQD